MKWLVFGSSIWASGERGGLRELCAALTQRGANIVLFERELLGAPQSVALPGGELCLYADWQQTRARVAHHAADAQVMLLCASSPDIQRAALHSVPQRLYFDDVATGQVSLLGVPEAVAQMQAQWTPLQRADALWQLASFLPERRSA